MSTVIVPDVAKKTVLKQLAGETTLPPAFIRLFKNDYVPVPGSDTANFTAADFSGYAQGAMDNPTVAGALDGSARAVCAWDEITWTKSGATGNTIYGYFVVDANDDLMWAERFDGSIPMTVDGAFIKITPRFTYKSEFNNS